MSGNEGMAQLINLVNKLQEAASKAGVSFESLNLPQVVVIGGQSVGKSSVLEGFVGKDFLPRGTGIVTRRPIILQLQNSDKEYVEFPHCPHQKFSDLRHVRREIEAETERETGRNKGISNKPIIMKVYSPQVLDLTLVDLPGITKVPVGEQPQDIEHMVKEMILDFISNENSIILAVSPANQDIALSDALKLANEVDPKGLRTIGVITKIDLMDQGTNCRNILENKVYPLSKGFIGLVNRGQVDIDAGKGIYFAQETEKQYFMNHPAYSHLAERMGSKYLQKVLNKELCDLIKSKMPLLKSSIKSKHADAKKQLEDMNAFEEEEDADQHKRSMLFRMVKEFSEEFKTEMEGHTLLAKSEKLSPGAQINRIFYQIIYPMIQEVCTSPNEEELKKVMQNLHGYRTGLFAPELAVDVTIRTLLTRFKEPLTQSVDLISEVLSNTLCELSQKYFFDYSRLKLEVMSMLKESLQKFEDKTKKRLMLHLDVEKAFINVKHPDFKRVSRLSEIPPTYNKRTEVVKFDISKDGTTSNVGTTQVANITPTKTNSDLEQATAMMLFMIDSYMQIVSRTINDLLPKYMTCFLVQKIVEFVNKTLLDDIMKDGSWIDLMELGVEEIQRKEKLFCVYEATSKALDVISELSFA